MIRGSLLARAIVALIPLACLDAAALGFGRGPGSAVLGSRLDFQVPVRLDAGEILAPECISAEVRFGESLVPPGLVSVSRVSSPAGEAIRVRTSSAIDEPLVSISITAGCEVRLSRRFTLFADPIEFSAPRLANADSLASPAPVAGPAAQIPASPAAPAADVPAAAAPTTMAPVTAAAAPVTAVSPPTGLSTEAARSAASAPSARTAEAPPATARASGAAAAGKSESPRKSAPRPRPSEAADSGSGRPKPDAAAQSRLTIDSPGLPKTAAAIREQQQVALKAAQDAALAAEAAASAAQARAASLEKTLEALQRDAKANREAVARLSEALASAQGSSNDSTIWMALAAAMLLVSGGLAVALRRQKQAGSSAWASGEASSASASVGLAPAAAPQSTEMAIGQEPVAAPEPAASVAAAPPEAAAMATAAALDVAAASAEPEVFGPVSSAPMRNISIEELLDLEQQVEFFTVLGQDEPAVELLTEHVRKTGGTHPFPYLKLLEIYRRLGERDAYERTRTRFNQRFNAVAPVFDAQADEESRPLEDYPRAIERIQRSWNTPVDAMATLENMLVRSEGREGFGVEALGEVLFLFTLARDVHLQQAGASPEAGSDVDVLLPFADSKPMGFADSSIPEGSTDGSQERSGSLEVNFEDDAEGPPVAAPMVSQSARFDITVGIPPEEAERALAQEPAARAAPSSGASASSQATPAPAEMDLPLGASLMGPLGGGEDASVSPSRLVDLPLGDSAMTPLEESPAELTLKGRSQLPLPASAQSDEASVDLELGGSMMGSLFGELPKPKRSAAEPEPPPLPSLEIPLEFESPSPPVAAAPAPLPTFEINLEGLELEPRPPKPAEGVEDPKDPGKN